MVYVTIYSIHGSYGIVLGWWIIDFENNATLQESKMIPGANVNVITQHVRRLERSCQLYIELVVWVMERRKKGKHVPFSALLAAHLLKWLNEEIVFAMPAVSPY